MKTKLSDEELKEIAKQIVTDQSEKSAWLVQAIRKHVNRGLIPQPWYLANSSTIRSMFRAEKEYHAHLGLFENQMVRKYMSDIIIERL